MACISPVWSEPSPKTRDVEEESLPTSIMAVIFLTKEQLIKTKLDAVAAHPIAEVCPSLPISAHSVLLLPTLNYCRSVSISLFWYSLSAHSILLLSGPLLQYWQFPKHKITLVSLSEFHRLFGISVATVIKLAKLSYSTAFPGRWCVVLYTLSSPLLRDHQIFIDDVFEKEVMIFYLEI